MYIHVRRNRIYLMLGVTALVCLVLYSSVKIFHTITASGEKIETDYRTVVIDPGHGGVDPGAIGVYQGLEKEVNLAIAMNLRDILTANGYRVVMTRETDVSIHDPKYTKISQIKTSDLKKRLEIIENQPGAITVLVHQNHYTSEAPNGAQMFFGKVNDQSKPLAEAMQNAFKENLQPYNNRAVKASTKSVFLAYTAKNPIVLAECGFMSNYKENKLLCDEEYQRKVAFTLFCGIETYRKEVLLRSERNPEDAQG